ncbi:MAG: hypothetical protein AAF646_13140 [Pseudomonadota bacterium]
MEITALRLANVRRFTDPVELRGIGPGINVLSAPNEHGKSTFFDALHAVFFLPHRSMNREAQALIPFSGGDPEVAVSFNAEGAAWRLEKRWSKSPGRKSARLWRDGTLVGQAGQAEDVLGKLLAPPTDGGPAGLLWVRQGVTELAAGGAEEVARQSLIASVAGEIDAMTGGRRMEAILARVTDDLGALVTTRGPKKGGALDAAIADRDALRLRADKLQADVDTLSEAIAERRRVRRALQGLADPELAAEREQALAAANSALAEGERYNATLLSARDAEVTARALLDVARDGRKRLADAIEEQTAAAVAVVETSQAQQEAQKQLWAKEEAFSVVSKYHSAARAAAEDARELYRRAVFAEQAAEAGAQRARLEGRLKKAETARSIHETAQAEALAGPDPEVVDRLRALKTAVTLAKQARVYAAPAIRVIYDGPGRVRIGDTALSGEIRCPISEPTTLVLDGIGRLLLDPGAGTDGADVATAETALTKALAQAGYPDLAAAEAALVSRKTAETAALEAMARLTAEAPDGIDALRAALAAIAEPAAADDGLPPSVEAAAAERAASQALDDAEIKLRDAREGRDHARSALARADAERGAADSRQMRADQALASGGAPTAALNSADAHLAEQRRNAENAAARRAELEAGAPDLDLLRARHARAKEALENLRSEVQTLSIRRGALDAEIRATASEAIEEELAETNDRLFAAEQRVGGLEDEVATLRCLAAALDAARSSARTRYVAPVLKELDPLLRLIWPEAELRIDADSLLPTELVRRGTGEPFDMLSGGTREQIALMVRLAFARMLARDGRPTPLILDDALIFSDDDRIGAMFDALTRQAMDQQVIVFSCRQRAFRDLGGQVLHSAPAISAGAPGGDAST